MSHSFSHRRGAAAVFAALCITLTATAHAQNSPGPQPVPLPPPIVAPADTPYPGTISLLVDATNITDRILSVPLPIPIHWEQSWRGHYHGQRAFRHHYQERSRAQGVGCVN